MAIGIDMSMLEGHSYIHALELEFERSQKTYSLTCEQELSRRLRVDLLLLHNENIDLNDALIDKEERVDYLEEDLETRNDEFHELSASMNNLRTELRAKMKEADRLQTEVNSLHALSQESSKLLEEKLSLAREISTLRPEIEHLRTQQSANTNILSEKLALQRQLQSVQVELENEKRSVQKAVSKDAGRSTREAKLENDLDGLRTELATEKALREKLEREGQKLSGHHEAQNAALESRLEDYRTKLKSAKEQIKSARSEADEAKKANERLLQDKSRLPAANRGKRAHVAIDADATIGTPDGFPPKRLNRGSTTVGQQSLFALTPFLNKTALASVETPTESEQENEPVEAAKGESIIPEPVVAMKKAPLSKAVPKAKAKAAKAPAQKKVELLEDVAEEDEEDDAALVPSVTIPSVEEEPAAKAQPPKKKRRVLGGGPSKTLFDDDDHVTGKVDSRIDLDDFKFAMPKRVTLAPKGAAALAIKGKGKAGGLGGFGAFSPLKKDRKQVK